MRAGAAQSKVSVVTIIVKAGVACNENRVRGRCRPRTEASGLRLLRLASMRFVSRHAVISTTPDSASFRHGHEFDRRLPRDEPSSRKA